MLKYWVFFTIILQGTLFSTGGFGPLPLVHAELLARGWATEQHFAEALAIGQITPGPNGFWIISLGSLVAGMPGALLTCIAVILPPFFVLLVQKSYTKIKQFPATQGVLDGIVLVVCSFSLVVLGSIFQRSQPTLPLLGITACSAILAYKRVISVNMIILLAVIIGAFL